MVKMHLKAQLVVQKLKSIWKQLKNMGIFELVAVMKLLARVDK